MRYIDSAYKSPFHHGNRRSHHYDRDRNDNRRTLFADIKQMCPELGRDALNIQSLCALIKDNDDGNTPLHLVFQHPNLREPMINAIIELLSQHNQIHALIAHKNKHGRTPLQVLIPFWIGSNIPDLTDTENEKRKIELFETLDNLLPGVIILAMTEKVDGFNVLHFMLQSQHTLKWDRQAGSALFQMLCEMAQCDFVYMPNVNLFNPDNLSLPSGTFILTKNNNSWMLVQYVESQISNIPDIEGIRKEFNYFEVNEITSLQPLLSKLPGTANEKIPAEIKTQIRRCLIAEPYIPKKNNTLFVDMFTAKNTNDQNIVQLAISSSLPHHDDNAPYQITPSSGLAAASSENYHLIWWMIAQANQEIENQSLHQPFFEILHLLLADPNTLNSIFCIIDIDPTLFYRLLSMLNCRELATVQSVFAEQYPNMTLSDMIVKKEDVNTKAFALLHVITLGKQLAENNPDIKAIFERLHQQYVVSDPDQNYPDYICNIEACEQDVHKIQQASLQKDAKQAHDNELHDEKSHHGIEQEKLTFAEVYEKAMQKFHEQIEQDSIRYQHKYTLAYFSLCEFDNNISSTYPVLETIGHSFKTWLLNSSNLLTIHRQAHEDSQMLCPIQYQCFLNSLEPNEKIAIENLHLGAKPDPFHKKMKKINRAGELLQAFTHELAKFSKKNASELTLSESKPVIIAAIAIVAHMTRHTSQDQCHHQFSESVPKALRVKFDTLLTHLKNAPKNPSDDLLQEINERPIQYQWLKTFITVVNVVSGYHQDMVDLSSEHHDTFMQTLALATRLAIVLENIQHKNTQVEPCLKQFFLARHQTRYQTMNIIMACTDFIRVHTNLKIDTWSIFLNHPLGYTDEVEACDQHALATDQVLISRFVSFLFEPNTVIQQNIRELLHLEEGVDTLPIKDIITSLICHIHASGAAPDLRHRNCIKFYVALLTLILLADAANSMKNHNDADKIVLLKQIASKIFSTILPNRLFHSYFTETYLRILAKHTNDDPIGSAAIIADLIQETLNKDKPDEAFAVFSKNTLALLRLLPKGKAFFQYDDPCNEFPHVIQLLLKIAIFEQELPDSVNFLDRAMGDSNTLLRLDYLLIDINKYHQAGAQFSSERSLMMSLDQYLTRVCNTTIHSFIGLQENDSPITVGSNTPPAIKQLLTAFVERICDPKHPQADFIAKRRQYDVRVLSDAEQTKMQAEIDRFYPL